MCGILLLYGPRATERMDACLPRLAHRGPDGRATWAEGQLAIGFHRLAINDKSGAGRQPYSHGSLIGVFNGEIYNHEALRREHGLTPEGTCDTHVILPLLERLAERGIDALDGFYSGLVFDRRTSCLYTLRDHVGKKPLYLGRSGSELFVTSELKALDRIEQFELLPRGFARVALDSGRVELERPHQPQERVENLDRLLEQAVLKRLPRRNEPLGLFLSGGLDSSIVAALTAPHRPDTIHYRLAGAGAPDLVYSTLVVKELGIEHVRTIPLPSREALPGLIDAVVRATESYNPSIVSNGLCTYLLAEAAHADGVKVVLTGDGADEFFCGYHRFTEDQPWRETRQHLIEDMQFTELRRLDTCTMAHAVETRCPFLDRAVCAHSDVLDYHEHYRAQQHGVQNKVALRRAVRGLLPQEVLVRSKTSFDVGSGVRGLVASYLRSQGRSERRELEELWRHQFDFDGAHPHFHSYPVFDRVIDTRKGSHR